LVGCPRGDINDVVCKAVGCTGIAPSLVTVRINDIGAVYDVTACVLTQSQCVHSRGSVDGTTLLSVTERSSTVSNSDDGPTEGTSKYDGLSAIAMRAGECGSRCRLRLRATHTNSTTRQMHTAAPIAMASHMYHDSSGIDDGEAICIPNASGTSVDVIVPLAPDCAPVNADEDVRAALPLATPLDVCD
jgi:hypothetical protein